MQANNDNKASTQAIAPAVGRLRMPLPRQSKAVCKKAELWTKEEHAKLIEGIRNA